MLTISRILIVKNKYIMLRIIINEQPMFGQKCTFSLVSSSILNRMDLKLHKVRFIV